MRDIKFRAWHNESKEYCEGSTSNMFAWSEEGQDVTLEQYTGLKDKNGVEIYEGDILLLKGKEEYNKPVVFYRGAFGVKGVTGNICALSSLVSFNRKFEVIGNTHQNQELIEGKK